jgi:hypothetical protein
MKASQKSSGLAPKNLKKLRKTSTLTLNRLFKKIKTSIFFLILLNALFLQFNINLG